MKGSLLSYSITVFFIILEIYLRNFWARLRIYKNKKLLYYKLECNLLEKGRLQMNGKESEDMKKSRIVNCTGTYVHIF